MAINFGLAQPAAGPLDILKMAGQAQLDKLTLQATQRKADQEQRIAASRPAVSASLQAGDYQGARRAAVGAGDYDMAEHVNSLSKEHLDQLDRETDTLGRVAFGLRNLPADQRATAAASAAPQLQQLGIDPSKIDASHLSDESLDGYISTATSLKDQIATRLATMKANEPTQVERELRAAGVPEGSPEWKDAILGHVNPSQFIQVGSDATGHSVVQTRGMGMNGGGTGGGGAPVGPQIEQVVMQIAPGSQVTSGRRTPEHNAEVGGVGNSYHLTDNARDVVPPQGVSMAQYHAQLKASLPGFDVINEGDHVHIEPSRQQQGGGGPRVVYSTPPAPKGSDAPSGYRFKPDGSLEAIPGGPGDARYGQGNRKAEADLRKEFDGLTENKNFRVVRSQASKILSLAKTPNAQNDIAMIFSYMKMLDPTSVVREGEFATAQNAAGVPEQIRNMYNKAQTGERLNADQRTKMVGSANTLYTSERELYNQRARQFRGYAQDNGVNPDRVASTYSNKKKAAPVDHGSPAGWSIARAN